MRRDLGPGAPLGAPIPPIGDEVGECLAHVLEPAVDVLTQRVDRHVLRPVSAEYLATRTHIAGISLGDVGKRFSLSETRNRRFSEASVSAHLH